MYAKLAELRRNLDHFGKAVKLFPLRAHHSEIDFKILHGFQRVNFILQSLLGEAENAPRLELLQDSRGYI